MIALDPYATALNDLMQVPFDGQDPWSKWTPDHVNAIRQMFGDTEGTAGGDDNDDAQLRQSNVTGGRMLFALSQSSLNPFRYSRVPALNGSYLPIVPLSLINSHLSAGVTALITHLRTHVLTVPTVWPPFNAIPMGDLWRMAPHQNWGETLPERRVSDGEAAWYLTNRAVRPYAMNEWQIRTSAGAFACNFSGKLVTDPGAIRFVSVTGRRTLTAQGWNYVHTLADPRQKGFRPDIQQPPSGKLGGQYRADGTPYTRTEVKKKDTPNYRGDPPQPKPFGVPDNVKRAQPKDYTVELHNRKPVRFYFSLNHYRSIVFNVKGAQVSLNPWFLIIDDA